MWDASTSKGKLGPTLKRVKAANLNCIAVYNDNIFKLHSKFYLSNNFFTIITFIWITLLLMVVIVLDEILIYNKENYYYYLMEYALISLISWPTKSLICKAQ